MASENSSTRFFDPSCDRYAGSAIMVTALWMWMFGETRPAFVATVGAVYWAVAAVGWLLQRRRTGKEALNV
jgi:hypothetical protein